MIERAFHRSSGQIYYLSMELPIDLRIILYNCLYRCFPIWFRPKNFYRSSRI